MSRIDSRATSMTPQHSANMTKTDDSSSTSLTPAATSENSVAYQYVAVQQMTTSRDHIEYQLTVREQPKQSRMCGVGEKADRRPIDPAPIVQLRVITHDRPVRQSDVVEDSSVAPPIERKPGHGPKQPQTPGVRRGVPVTTALGDGWEDKAWYLENPYFFMYAMLCNADTDEELHLLNDGKTRYTSGSCVSCLYHLKDIDGSHQGFFVFPDLSIRVEGRYRLKLCLFETIGHSVHHCKSVYSDPFHVYTAKRFPGMEESTKLSKSFAEQGLKVRVRKHPRSRRRSSKRTKDDSEASDLEAASSRARDRSPKRARASDILPQPSLAVPQPTAPRLTRTLDSRYERPAFDRRASNASVSTDPQPPPPHPYSLRDEEEAMRVRAARSRDAVFDNALYARHARDERPMDPPAHMRDFADARYAEERVPRDRPPPALPSMPLRAPHEYPEYGRVEPPRDDRGRALPPAPQPAATSPHHTHPSLAGQRYAPALPNAPPSARPYREYLHAYGAPESGTYEPARGYDAYAASRPGVRYGPSLAHERRDAQMMPASATPPPPPPGSLEPSGWHAGPPSSRSHWRSGPPSPRRAAEYHVGPGEREYASRRSPVPPGLPLARGILTPPAAFVGEGSMYHRHGHGAGELARGPTVYESEVGAARPMRYLREDFGPERAGPGGRGMGGERPMLPPLSAPPPLAQRRDMGRERDAGYGATERFMPPSGHGARAPPPLASNEAEQAERERERERAWERERDEAYGAREWEARRASRPYGGSRPPYQ
ncbi:hypothetical protein PANT_7c00294 [Moesziomyces antarcticus T-34]|uniref:Velvet domain-containing protein n=1 Tax=Pseudozyma antarctica (strain T-34) TaxID=1151754 RepID=M9LML8_PSEA3|nr:hypothetical protein PANT_7c00294 [Moesziomyces antarcticus T-34]